MSFCPHGTTRFPSAKFLLNPTLGNFNQILHLTLRPNYTFYYFGYLRYHCFRDTIFNLFTKFITSRVYYAYLRNQSHTGLNVITKETIAISVLLGCNTAHVGSCLQTFRNNPSVPFSKVRQFIPRNILEKRRPQVPSYLG
jgi:hypothetical protein